MSPRLALLGLDIVPGSISGLGLRYVGLAAELSRHFDVTLLVRDDAFVMDGVQVHARPSEFGQALRRSDVVVSPYDLTPSQRLAVSGMFVRDLYDFSIFEASALSAATGAQLAASWKRSLGLALRQADVMLCANERQRDLLMGAVLAARGRGGDHLENARVLVVPNGIDESLGVPEHPPAAEVDTVLCVWGGGLWRWLDPLTAIHAFELAARTEPTLRLAILGGRRSTSSAALDQVDDVKQAVASSALLRKLVEFSPEWSDPTRRADVLRRADLGLLAQPATLETHFSFRTRLMDCLAVGAGVVSTIGDQLTQQAVAEGWGLAAATNSAEALAEQLALAAQPDTLGALKDQALGARTRYSWSAMAGPLVAYVRDEAGATKPLHARVGHAATSAIRHRLGL